MHGKCKLGTVLLALLAQQCSGQWNFERFAHVSVKVDTGFEAETLSYTWRKYNAYGGSRPGTFGGQLPSRLRDPSYAAFYFYLVFVYLHQCPQLNWIQNYKTADGRYKASERSMSAHVWPTAQALANIIDEVDYTWRFNQFNHGLPPFDKAVTGIVDTLPIVISTPHSWWLSTLFYQPKYKATVVKMQLGISFMGDIILWTGPHLGVISDISIWESTWAEHPFCWWERWLADLGYVGAIGLIYKFKKAAGRLLTREEIVFNNVHEFMRNRVEQMVSAVKNHRICKPRVFRGSFETLKPFLIIVGHVTAYEVHAFGPRFVCYGPWPH